MAQILIVEDDMAIADSYGFRLEKAGHTVQACGSATDALSWLGKNHPDLIILDMLMPDMSGLDFLRKLPTSAKPPKVHLIVLSNTESPKVKQDALDLGVEQYLLKVDYTPHQITDLVAGILGSAPAA